MYGIEAINASNGWAISAVGVSIVFSGLVSLSFVISQLHKILDLWENPSKLKKLFKSKKPAEPTPDEAAAKAARDSLTLSQKETIKQYALLVRTMENHFSLSRLLHLAIISGLNNPHENLNQLVKTRIIQPDGEGFFTWDKATFDQTV